MSALAIAHKELEGDLRNASEYYNNKYLFVHELDGDYLCDSDPTEECGYTYISTVEEFNNFKGNNVEVYTQEMADNGVLPSVGMECLFDYNTDFDCKFDFADGDVLVCVCHSTDADGCTIGVYRHMSGVTISLNLNLIKPLTPPITMEEQAIKDACYIVDDSKRCNDTNINIDCSAAQKAVIITLIKNGYTKPITVEAKS
tara:strand:+ start:265 stop:864 length:600 start_codon:yes stop_codon:yes gene_type:complete